MIVYAITEFSDLSLEPASRQPRMVLELIIDVVLERVQNTCSRCARAVYRYLGAALEILANGLAILACTSGNLADRQAVLSKLMKHEQLPMCDHRDLLAER